MIKDKFDIEFEMVYKNEPSKIEKPLIRVLSLREFGNKLHGDTFEIVINRMIDIFFPNISSFHIGKIYFRSKSFDADIVLSLDKNLLASDYAFIKNAINKIETSKPEKKFLLQICEKYKQFDINQLWKSKDYSHLLKFLLDFLEKMKENIIEMSLKCYGEGSLQLYTDANHEIFPYLMNFIDDEKIEKQLSNEEINEIKCSNLFDKVRNKKVLVLKYSEKKYSFSLLTTNIDNFLSRINSVKYTPRVFGKGKKVKNFEIFKFYDIDNNYVFEVRYGGSGSNALQRGIWTNTEKSQDNFFKLIDNKTYCPDTKYLEYFANSFFIEI